MVIRPMIVFCCLVVSSCGRVTAPSKITIVGPVTAFAWPTYIAIRAGYYEKYGLNVTLKFANHPADVAMLASGGAQVNLNTLETALRLSSKSSEFVAVGSPLRRLSFALVASKGIGTIRDLRGKRVGITQLGGNTYHYAASLLATGGVRPNEVAWISLGGSARVAALVGGRVDATMLSAPAYFGLEEKGYKVLSNIMHHEEIQSANVVLMSRSAISLNPKLPKALIQAHAEAVKRFYEDKTFALEAYASFDRQNLAELDRVYRLYATTKSFDIIPYISTAAVRYAIQTQDDGELGGAMRTRNYREVVDNRIVDELIAEGFFERLFGKDAAAAYRAREEVYR